MSRFPRLRRRPDAWHDAHERARVRAAERLDGPLGLAETQWLDEHLAGCPACAAVAAAYAQDRQALRGLRNEFHEPPGDLWGRTAAAIEQLSTEGGPAPETARAGSLLRLPLAAMSAVAVVVVVVGASLLTRGITTPQTSTGASPRASSVTAAASASPTVPGAEATPFAVSIGSVSWVNKGPGGLGFSSATVTEVCPEGSSDCAPVPDEGSRDLVLDSAPRTVIGSPKSKQAVAISKTPGSGDQVVLVELPEGDAASPSPTPAQTAAPTATPSDASATPPEDTDEPPVSPTPTVVVSSAPPSASPLETPEATTTKELAIASGIEVVGESAAFSADGTWFAFTARPRNGGGPDVDVWHVGADAAKRLTTDGASYFASWSGDRAVVSRPADPVARISDPLSVLIDPSTGGEEQAGALWRPMVDPSGSFAVGWDGTVARVQDPLGWAPANGRLMLRSWSGDRDSGAPNGSDDHRTLADHAAGDFDVRWDETGAWVAIWVGNDGDATVGRLTLYHLDATKGRLEHVKGAPEDVQALSGFSNGGGRLAWATPRGSNGEGTRVQIAAWKVDEVGIVASSPGEDVVVIR